MQRVALHRLKSGVADGAAEFLFRRAVGHAGSTDDVFLEHYRADVVAAEAECDCLPIVGNPQRGCDKQP